MLKKGERFTSPYFLVFFRKIGSDEDLYNSNKMTLIFLKINTINAQAFTLLYK